MAKSRYHKTFEIRIHFSYSEEYKGMGTVPDSFIEQFSAVSFNGAMKTANVFVAIEERQMPSYMRIESVSVKPI